MNRPVYNAPNKSTNDTAQKGPFTEPPLNPPSNESVRDSVNEGPRNTIGRIKQRNIIQYITPTLCRFLAALRFLGEGWAYWPSSD